MEKKTFIEVSNSEFSQRFLDLVCLNELSETFNVEYWDCSALVCPSYHPANRIECPSNIAHRKFDSLEDLKTGLSQLPKDALLFVHAAFDYRNYKFHKLVSSFFPEMIVIDFWCKMATISSPEQSSLARMKNDIKDRLKVFLFKNKILRFIIRSLAHPSAIKKNYQSYIEDKERLSYRKVYKIDVYPETKYRINSPDLDKYMQNRGKQVQKNSEKYIVYIDEFFPYHSEIKYFAPDLDIESLAEPFFKSLNSYFDWVEKKYQCKVIIACHPTARYDGNPFGGREMAYFKTNILIEGAEFVLTQCSNALSWVVLENKPCALLTNDQMKEARHDDAHARKLHRAYGFVLIDIDDSVSREQEIRPVSAEMRKKYLTDAFGEYDIDNYVPNAELYKRYLNEIYTEMYQK